MAATFAYAAQLSTASATLFKRRAIHLPFDFDRNGKFAGTHLLTIIPATPQR
jgi:hypothetical protein